MKLTDITVSRAIPAPAERVFDVWMDPHSPGGPWYGSERSVRKSGSGRPVLFSREAGRTRLGALRPLPPYRSPPTLVEYTWVSEATKGLESIVSVTFEARGAQTEVTLRHSGIPDDELGRKHKDGWTWVLSMLGERFGS